MCDDFAHNVLPTQYLQGKSLGPYHQTTQLTEQINDWMKVRGPEIENWRKKK